MSRKRASHTSGGDGKLKVSYKVHVVHRDRRARLVEGTPPPEPLGEVEPKGTIPRISRLLALAHHIQELLDTGQVQSLAEVARLGHITRPRMTQIMNLLLLAPEIQEAILLLRLPPKDANQSRSGASERSWLSHPLRSSESSGEGSPTPDHEHFG